MTYRLRVECIAGRFLRERCVRVLAIDSENSLLDLHYLILQAVEFDQDHLYHFYTANSGSPRVRHYWVSEAERHEDRRDDFADIQLADIWPLGRQKLYYWYDFGDDWLFEIRKVRPSKADATLTTPSVVERIGPNPEQYPDLEE